jgi:hypothetical protein
VQSRIGSGLAAFAAAANLAIGSQAADGLHRTNRMLRIYRRNVIEMVIIQLKIPVAELETSKRAFLFVHLTCR